MEEHISTILLTPALSSMKRSVLQKLCKKYGLKANGKNTDLQKNLKQYALKNGGNINMENLEMMDIDHNPDIDKSSQRNQFANNVSQPSTPQTPSVIPLEQQNKVRSSLVDDSPINMEISQHEIKPTEFSSGPLDSINTVGQCLSLIPYKEPLFFNLAKKHEDNMTESMKEEMEDVNTQKQVIDTDNMDYTVERPIIENLVPDEKNDLNPIPLNPAFEQVEINKPVMANIFVSPLKPSSNLMPIEPRTPPSKHIRSVETERASTNLMARLTDTPVVKFGARMNSLPSYPETKAGPALDKNSPFITRETNLNFETMQNSLQIQEEVSRAEVTENDLTCDEQTKSTGTADLPLYNNGNAITASVYKELETRVAQLKALPSPERKKILGTNNAKSEIPVATPSRRNSEASLIKQTSSSTNRFTQVHEKVFSQMPSIVSHYAAHKPKNVGEAQDEINRKRKDCDNMQPSIKKQKLAHSKSQEIRVVKKAYDINRTIKNNRASVRLAKKNIIPNLDEQKKREREEFEKRKQAARNVAQPVLEKVKNKRKTKENVERKPKDLQNTQNVKIEKKKSSSLLPRKAQ